jgi:hypothetical protein
MRISVIKLWGNGSTEFWLERPRFALLDIGVRGLQNLGCFPHDGQLEPASLPFSPLRRLI